MKKLEGGCLTKKINIEKIGKEVKKLYNSLEVSEDEEKGILSIIYVRDKKNQKIDVNQTILNDSNITMVRAICLLLRDKKENEIQNIFEAVKEFV